MELQYQQSTLQKISADYQDPRILRELLEASENHNKKLKDLVELLKSNSASERQRSFTLNNELQNAKKDLEKKDQQIAFLEMQLENQKSIEQKLSNQINDLNEKFRQQQQFEKQTQQFSDTFTQLQQSTLNSSISQQQIQPQQLFMQNSQLTTTTAATDQSSIQISQSQQQFKQSQQQQQQQIIQQQQQQFQNKINHIQGVSINLSSVINSTNNNNNVIHNNLQSNTTIQNQLPVQQQQQKSMHKRNASSNDIKYQPYHYLNSELNSNIGVSQQIPQKADKLAKISTQNENENRSPFKAINESQQFLQNITNTRFAQLKSNQLVSQQSTTTTTTPATTTISLVNQNNNNLQKNNCKGKEITQVQKPSEIEVNFNQLVNISELDIEKENTMLLDKLSLDISQNAENHQLLTNYQTVNNNFHERKELLFRQRSQSNQNITPQAKFLNLQQHQQQQQQQPQQLKNQEQNIQNNNNNKQKLQQQKYEELQNQRIQQALNVQSQQQQQSSVPFNDGRQCQSLQNSKHTTNSNETSQSKPQISARQSPQKSMKTSQYSQQQQERLFEEFFIIGANPQEVNQISDKNEETQYLKPYVLLQYTASGIQQSQKDIIADFVFPFGVETKKIKLTNSFSNINEILFANYTVESTQKNENVNCFVLGFKLNLDQQFQQQKKQFEQDNLEQVQEEEEVEDNPFSKACNNQKFQHLNKNLQNSLNQKFQKFQQQQQQTANFTSSTSSSAFKINQNSKQRQINPSNTLYCICYQIKDFQETTIPKNSNSKTNNFDRKKLKFMSSDKVFCFVTYYPFVQFFLQIITTMLNTVKERRIKVYTERLESAHKVLCSIDSHFAIQRLEEIVRFTLNDLILLPIPYFSETISFKFNLNNNNNNASSNYIGSNTNSLTASPLMAQSQHNNNNNINNNNNSNNNYNSNQNNYNFNSKNGDLQQQNQLQLLQQQQQTQNQQQSSSQSSFTVSYQLPNCAMGHRIELDWGIELAMTQFSLDQFVYLYMALLTEVSLVFVSKNITLLTTTLLLFYNQLVLPFKLVHPIVFSMPKNLLQLCDSPVPLLAGLNRDKAFLQESGLGQTYPNCMFVYLGPDFEIINQGAIKSLSIEAFVKIKERIRPFFEIFNPEDQIKKENKYISLSRSLKTGNPLISDKDLKEACFKVVETLHSFFREEVIAKLPKEPFYIKENPTLLDYEKIGDFTLQAMGSNDLFMKRFFKSQMFTYYLEEKYLALKKQ